MAIGEVLNNGQSPRTIVGERIVGLAGGLIGAPTCRVETTIIPGDSAGWEFRPGLTTGAGAATRSCG